jgi:selenide,water dikinase
LPVNDNDRVLIDYRTSDDAGVYKLDESRALVQTVDFFTPIVDDPYIYGQIAAANALSDVYAMGGRPLTALNILCFPIDSAPAEVLRQILLGGFDKMREAGVAVVGGHSVEDKEPKFGAAVTGIVDPDKAITNAGAKPGQKIFLTKALGTGIVATAAKFDACPPSALQTACESMMKLNKEASEVAVRHGVRAGTDVTGFGLAGHLSHIARNSNIAIRIDSNRLPILPEAIQLALAGHVTAGANKNAEWLGDMLQVGPVASGIRDIVLDPQTSGGLVLCIDPAVADAFQADLPSAVEIGETLPGPPSIQVH